MKKTAILLLAALVSVSALAGCKKKEEAPAPVVSETPVISAEIEEEPEDTMEGMSRSYLTGEWIDENVAAQRPFAVMMGNSSDALPQYGITSADIVYEAPVEGGLTRLMGIFQDYANVEKIMSVRSCRRYYIDWALEFDAIYGHYGQAVYAEPTLARDDVNNLSGLESGVEAVMYSRDSSRKSPHNAYTNGEGIIAGIEHKGYTKEHGEDYTGHYLFNEDEENEITLDNGQDAVVVRPGYFVNKPWFVYDSETGLYNRFEYKKAQTDGNNDEQVKVKNIIIQSCSWEAVDKNGYLDVFTTAGGSGYYITNGKAIPVTWTKDSEKAPTRYFDADGNEITLNRGKTWVCITQDTYADNIAFYATEEEFESAE